MSTNNTKAKLINLIRKMQEKGLWLTYKRLEKGPRSSILSPPKNITRVTSINMVRNLKTSPSLDQIRYNSSKPLFFKSSNLLATKNSVIDTETRANL